MECIIRKAEEKDITRIFELLLELIDLNNDKGFLLEQIRLLSFDSNYYVAVADMKGHVVSITLGICVRIYTNHYLLLWL